MISESDAPSDDSDDCEANAKAGKMQRRTMKSNVSHSGVVDRLREEAMLPRILLQRLWGVEQTLECKVCSFNRMRPAAASVS